MFDPFEEAKKTGVSGKLVYMYMIATCIYTIDTQTLVNNKDIHDKSQDSFSLNHTCGEDTTECRKKHEIVKCH